MERLKAIVFRILRPGAVWLALLTLLSAAALIYTFSTNQEDTPIGYVSYVLSAYTMTALVIFFLTMTEKIKSFITKVKNKKILKSFVSRNKYSKRFITDIPYRVKATLYTTLILNLLYAALKLIAGIYYASFWYGADALYYIVLSTLRVLLLRQIRKEGRDLSIEFRIYRFCGILLFALNATLTGVVYQTINKSMGYQYPGLLIYIVATFTFGFLVTAIVNVLQYRKFNRPLFSAVMMTSLAQALVAMFALQSAMFASFGNSESQSLKDLMNSLTGAGVCIAIFGMAVYMVVQANQNLKILRINNIET